MAFPNSEIVLQKVTDYECDEREYRDFIPEGFACSITAFDIGLVWNQESDMTFAKPGEFVQFSFNYGIHQIHVIVAKRSLNWIEYYLRFGDDTAGAKMPPALTKEEVKQKIQEYFDASV